MLTEWNLTRTTGAWFLALSLSSSASIGAELPESDEALIYQHLFPEAESGHATARAHQWDGFANERKREAWGAAQIEAIKAAFKRKPDSGKATERQEGSNTHPYQELVSEYAAAYGLDPLLIHQVIKAESGYDPNAISPKGAKGLMQLMDGLSRQFNINPFDPESNIKVGVGYLAELLERFGRMDLALAAYNAGPSVVEKYDGIPPYPETQHYVSKITASLGTAPTGR